ncbi:MAG: hypothetical protein IIU14_01645 [Ruminococcus sp.]|nr:hypothetical protein [Ruminococcus sp.]
MSESVLDYRELERPRQYGFGVKLFFLYTLNAADWFCTQALIDTGRFQEANPLMASVMEYPIVGFFIKCVLPLALSIFIWLFYKIFKLEQNKFTNFIIYSGVIIYSAVILVHIVNFIILYTA